MSAKQVQERGERKHAVRLEALSLQDQEAELLRTTTSFSDQARLPDPSVAGDENGLTLAADHLAKHAIERGQRGRAADEDGTDGWPAGSRCVLWSLIQHRWGWTAESPARVGRHGAAFLSGAQTKQTRRCQIPRLHPAVEPRKDKGFFELIQTLRIVASNYYIISM
jgi:hypothetical protein